MKAEISVETTDAGVLMRVRGDVDMNTSPDVRAGLGEVFRGGAAEGRTIVIDLSQVRYMDSSGIATLVEALQICMKKRIRLRLAELSPPVRDVFELARLAGVFEIYANASEALNKV